MHPAEFMMASASIDRTVRLWDLESFEQVCCLPQDNGQVRKVVFSEDGKALFNATDESLKVWGWEPMCCFDQSDHRWSRLADMCISPNHGILAGSIRESTVAIWSVDVMALEPFRSPPMGQRRGQSLQVQVCSQQIGNNPKGGSAPRHTAVQPEGTDSSVAALMPAAGLAAASKSIAQNADDSAAVQCARMHIAECRAQLAAVRRASQNTESEASRCMLANSIEHEPKSNDATKAPSAGDVMSMSGNHVSVGTSMTNTLQHVAETTAAPSVADYSTSIQAPVHTLCNVDDAMAVQSLRDGGHTQGARLASRRDALRSLLSYWQAGQVKQARDEETTRVFESPSTDLPPCCRIPSHTPDDFKFHTVETSAMLADASASQEL